MRPVTTFSIHVYAINITQLHIPFIVIFPHAARASASDLLQQQSFKYCCISSECRQFAGCKICVSHSAAVGIIQPSGIRYCVVVTGIPTYTPSFLSIVEHTYCIIIWSIL